MAGAIFHVSRYSGRFCAAQSESQTKCNPASWGPITQAHTHTRQREQERYPWGDEPGHPDGRAVHIVNRLVVRVEGLVLRF